MSLDYAILGFLSEGEHSGYDLKTRCFDREASHFWTADQAQVYRTLDRLENRQWVTSRYEPQRGKPGRKLYSITPPGRKQLIDWLAQPHDPTPYRDPFLIQLYFADALKPDALRSVLEASRATHQSRLENLRRRLGECTVGSAGGSRSEFTRLTLEATLARTRATIDWLDNCIDALHPEDRAALSGSGSSRPRPDGRNESKGSAS